jgi:O-antigen/teichoic acid export membrane protein
MEKQFGLFFLPVAKSRHAVRMSTRFGLAVCDQAIFAGASFVFTVLLARWMTQTDFGAFSVAYAFYILLQNIYEGLVHEPFGIFGSGRLLHQLNVYVGRVLIGLLVLGIIFAVITMSIAFAMQTIEQPALAKAFCGLSVALTFLLARVLTRQPLYIIPRLHWSIGAGVAYFVTTLGMLYLLERSAFLTPFSGFLAMGIGSALSSGFIVLKLLRPIWRSPDVALAPRRLISEHIAYGKWAIWERLLLWLQTNIFYLELPLVTSLHASAAYRAISTLAMPAYMTMSAFGGILLPTLVRAEVGGAKPHWVGLLLPGAALVLLGYGAIMVGFGFKAAHLLFAGQYDTDVTTPLLVALGIGPALASISMIQELKLRARLQIKQILVARIAATIGLLLIGVGLTAQFQLLGAAITLAFVWLITAAIYWCANRR